MRDGGGDLELLPKKNQRLEPVLCELLVNVALELVTTTFEAAEECSLVVGLVSALETPLLGALAVLVAHNVLFEANVSTGSAEPASDWDAEASETGPGPPSDASMGIGIWTLRGAASAAAPRLELLSSAEGGSIESTTLWLGLSSRLNGDAGSEFTVSFLQIRLWIMRAHD